MNATISIDEVQAYWDARPCNIRHSEAQAGTHKFFEEVDRRKRLVEPHIDSFANYPEWKGKKILEVGCGIGTDTERFARAGAYVTAIDLSPYSVVLTRQRLKLNDLNATVIQGDAEDLASLFEGETFDLVYSFGVIHHTVQPVNILKGMRELSHKDTVCRVMVYNRYSLKVLKLTKGRFWRSDLVALQSEAESGCPITQTYSPRQLRQLMLESGFEVESISKDHIFPYRVKDYVEYKYKETTLARTLPHRTFNWLESHVGWHLMAQAFPC